MRRRDFCIVCGLGLSAVPFVNARSFVSPETVTADVEKAVWIHGSPYLGHADCRMDFHGLRYPEVWKEVTHFRTSEPWRRAILFKL